MATYVSPSQARLIPSGLDDALIDELSAALRGRVLQPDDEAYDAARRVWNGMIDRYPAAIARCAGTADVVAAVQFARRHDLRVAVRGGGHNVAGHAVCEGGLVIDLSMMNAVQVDPQRMVARVQGGATWGDLDRETQLFGLATPGGEVSTTGVAGYTLSGGIGVLHRKWGLACDNVLGFELVTADGEVRRVSMTEHPDLYWALRGGGGNFGVVTWFEFQLHPLGPEVYAVTVLYPAEDAAQILRGWRDYTAHAPDEITAEVFIWRVPAFPEIPEALHNSQCVAVNATFAGTPAAGEVALQPLRELGQPVLDMSGVLPYTVLQSGFDSVFPPGLHCYWKSLFIEELSDALIDEIVARGGSRPSIASALALRHLGGAISQIPDDATAFANRAAQFNLSVDAIWEDPADHAVNIAWAQDTWEALRPYTAGGVYLNFAGLAEDSDTLVRAGHGLNVARLREVKRRYDPGNLFRGNVNIIP